MNIHEDAKKYDGTVRNQLLAFVKTHRAAIFIYFPIAFIVVLGWYAMITNFIGIMVGLAHAFIAVVCVSSVWRVVIGQWNIRRVGASGWYTTVEYVAELVHSTQDQILVTYRDDRVLFVTDDDEVYELKLVRRNDVENAMDTYLTDESWH